MAADTRITITIIIELTLTMRVIFNRLLTNLYF
jgi:hypothetical protein